MDPGDGTEISRFQKKLEKHALLLRFFALLMSGTALGLIFNALCGYEYSAALLERVRYCFMPPFEGSGGFSSVFGIIINSASVDILTVLLIYLFGVTYICREGCSALLVLRGVCLGISAGALASSAAGKMIETAHPVACSVCFLGVSAAVSVLLVLSSCLAQRASVLFRGLSERSPNMIFTARFAAYALAFAASAGAVILLRALYLLLIYLLTK